MAREIEESGPGMGGPILAGLISLLIGMIIGSVSLVSQEVSVLTKTPDPESLEPGSLVYVKGTRSGRTSWRGKEQAWKAGQLSTLILTETELNQWSESRLKAKNPTPADDEGSWLDTFEVTVSPVNFRIIDDKLQLATVVGLPGLMPSSSYIYQVTGHFESVSGSVEYVPDSGAIGQAPVGAVPGAGGLMLSFISKKCRQIEDADWILEAFNDLESAEITDGQLILRRKSEG